MPKIIRDSHTSHCCAIPSHGCKYNDSKNCTVLTGKAPQEYLCEECESARYDCQRLQEIFDEHAAAAPVPEHFSALRERLIQEGYLHRDPPLQEREAPSGEYVFTFEEAVRHCMEIEATRMQQRSHAQIVQTFLQNPWMDWSEERILKDFRNGLGQSIAMREFVCRVFVESQKGNTRHKVYERAEDPDIPKE